MSSMMLNLDEARRRQHEIEKESNRTGALISDAERSSGVASAITGLIRRAARPGKPAPAKGRPALA